jgi:hypothetical protein
VDTALPPGRIAEIEPGLTQLAVNPADWPPALLAAVEPGAWDSVFVWAPPPDGGPAPTLGATDERNLFRGASLSVLASSRAGSRENLDLTVVHEWWHQVVARADRLLGVALLTNHEPLVVEEPALEEDDLPVRQTLDPRAWAASDTVGEWYETVLGELVQPELWVDLWRGGERAPFAAGNLALSARVVSDSVLNPEGLNDGWVDPGSFDEVPTVDPDADDYYFGLAWDTPVTARTLQAWIGRVDAPATVSFRGAAIEAVLADAPTVWRALQLDCATADDTFTCKFPPLSILAIRLRPDSVDAVIRELEVR